MITWGDFIDEMSKMFNLKQDTNLASAELWGDLLHFCFCNNLDLPNERELEFRIKLLRSYEELV